ncbi:MAG: lipase family protein [Candidatus Thiodiazotropha sp.]
MTSENDIRKLNAERISLLIECSIQAYNALSEPDVSQCATDKVKAPSGFELIDSWSGVDSLFGRDSNVETYGVVFRSTAAPWRYIFAFRGTDSLLDMLDDCGVESQTFMPFESTAQRPDQVLVESGFNDIYRYSDGSVASMQEQLFSLVDRYQNSAKPLSEIYITGHSLGGALCQLFTLDLALSRPLISGENINFASPRVGNRAFVDLYGAQTHHSTLRVVNVHDAVPRLPPSKLGFRHHPSAYLVAFHARDIFGELDLKAAHSSQNYQAVIHCAQKSGEGCCNNHKLQVDEDLAICSEVPQVGEH